MQCRNSKIMGFAASVCLAVFTGCVTQVENEVVIYAASDREYATPILDAFEKSHPGVSVSRQFDVESTKTLGLVTRIQQESKSPRCDVFWNNEILHTIRLSRSGLLKARKWKVPDNWPAGYKAKDGTWIGFAARARVLIVNTQKLISESDRPKSVLELGESKWSNRCGVAFPLYGTTATHFAVMAIHLRSELPSAEALVITADDAATRWFKNVQKNAAVLSGNKQVAQAVSAGQLDWGITDTDDAMIEIENGMPVTLIYPDQLPDQLGTLLIPNCIAVLDRPPHLAAAGLLADYLVSETTETLLTTGNSAQIPIWPNANERSRAEPTAPVRWMNVDFERAADAWPNLAQELLQLFRK